MAKQIKVTPHISIGGDQDKLLLISGPCQIESLDHSLRIAETLSKFCEDLPISLVFKSSYDKANRTSIHGKRGLGMEEGLRVLEEVKKQTGLPTLTDVHLPEQATSAAEVVDILQTPAFLCRQTDLLTAVAKTGKAVNIKKGQFLAPDDMGHVAEKITAHGNSNVMLCERGTCFGYRDLIVDMRSLDIMRKTGHPVIFDATHSVQSMGGQGGSSGGSREFVFPLIRAACAVGIDGLFIESHDNPDQAPSDGASMLPLEQLPKVLDIACKLHSLARESLPQVAAR